MLLLSVIGAKLIDLYFIFKLKRSMKKVKTNSHCVINKLLTALKVNNVKAGISDTITKKILKIFDRKSSLIFIILLKKKINKIDKIELNIENLSINPI